MEVELKLLVPPDDLLRIDRHPAVRAARRGGGRKLALETVYYDTPEADLAHAGVALRLRRDGDRWVQTLKGGGTAAAGLHARDEIEWDLTGQTLNVGLLDDTRYAELFAKRKVRGRLQPVFTTEFERTLRTLALPDGTLAELALDRGVIRAGHETAPISEAEIELKGGDAARLFGLARAIARDVPVRLGHASKAERGYALGRGAPPPRKARPVPLEATMTAGDALRRIAMACIAQMQSNEDGVRGGRDPEYLHQLRVGLRRLRSSLGLVALASSKEAVAPLAGELRWLGGALGPARDWDVFMTETFARLARQFRQAPGVASFRARAARVRRAHAATARDAVSSQRYTDLLLALGEAFARDDLPVFAGSAAPAATQLGSEPPPRFGSPVGAFAAFVMDRRHRRVRKRGRQVPEAPPEERHRVRIAAKKLRYAAEFFAPLYPAKRVARYVAALQDLQDILGALNDAAVVDRLLAELAGTGRPIAAGVDGLVRGWVAAVAQQELARYRRAWREFENAKPFWK
ncbi:MAG TPA: CHAD domain-containing protein [Burkholderiales bacterium]|nr:CHAD domain-containing protein [Burkholderiales bacterium]